MSTIPQINKLSAYIGTFHAQYHLWIVQHVLGHHIHTNIIFMDPDVHHFSHDRKEEEKIPGYRTHPKQKVLKKYKWGWKFAILFQVWATTFAIAFANTPKYLADRAMEVTKIPTKWLTNIRNDRIILLSACMLFMWYHGAVYGFWCLFHVWGVHGTCFNVFSQISHTNEESMTSVNKYKKKYKIKKIEWAMHQMLTTSDYSCDSWFWSIVSIHLNNQAMHHLFPSVHPCHYPAMRRKLIPVCAKFGVNYEQRSSGDFFDAVARYLGWISKLNENGNSMAVAATAATAATATKNVSATTVASKSEEEAFQHDIKKDSFIENDGCVSTSSRVLAISGTLIVCATLAIPTMACYLPAFQWAPLQAFVATLIPLILTLRFQEYDDLHN